MQLENKFTIEAPIEKAWEALNTPQTVAPCFPGATLQEYEGDSFTGTVKVKLGPISLTYKGKGTYVTRDDENHKVVIEATGRDSRGNGTANATVTGTMVADGPTRTAVTMLTDMTITGRPAQFGRGVISDVADKIIGQFSSCVASKLAPEEEAAAPASGSAPTPASAAEAGGGSATNGSGSPSAAATATATATAPAKGPVL
ncbi:SRPBCC family protein, partial [Pseudonocardia sp.]|uniref:SRPBCC family protein n=1 Tax=Pseudonocardia sp. TaxID=60912 RepID=UPI0031FCEC17